MESTAPLANSRSQSHASKASGVTRRHRRLRWAIAITLWVLGLILLGVASVFVHSHPGPWPFELEFTRTVQSQPFWSWLSPVIDFFGTFNNPTPSGIAIGFVFTAILLMGWYRQAIFLALAVGIGDYIDTLIGNYVARLRPSPALVRVDVVLKYNSFPSGHCCHVVLFYGFLLFLSFTRPVRRWHYHWALIPLQVFAALNILLIGFSRVYEGEHWATDILGGYLSGALWLALFIFLYQWTAHILEERRARKLAQKPMQVQEA